MGKRIWKKPPKKTVVPKAKAKALPKAKAKALPKATAKKALPKAKALPKDKCQPKLTAKALQKADFEGMTLDEKMEKVAEEATDQEEAAEMLKAAMSKKEHSSVWQKHQTHLKSNPEEKEALQKASHKEKGLAAALWLLSKSKPAYFQKEEKAQAGHSLKKVEEWCSWKQMLAKFDEEELNLHLNSGRVIWREDPMTMGAYQYQDRGALKKVTFANKRKSLKKGTEAEPEEQEDNKWEALFGSNLSSFLVDDLQDLGKSSALAKGKGKGLGKDKSKGKKGKQQLALEDLAPLEEGEEQPPAEETLEEVLKGCRKARDTLQGWLNSFEEVEELVNSSKVLGKATLRKADCLKKQVCEHLGFYKTVLLKKRESSEKELKAKLLATASLVKEAKSLEKDISRVAQSAESLAGESSTSKKSKTKK